MTTPSTTSAPLPLSDSDVNADATRALAGTLSDPACCTSDLFMAEDVQLDLTTLNAASYRLGWCAGTPSSHVDTALAGSIQALISIMPMLPGTAPFDTPRDPEFAWAANRAIVSSFGAQYWAGAVDAMCRARPDCPWSADETKDMPTWIAAAHDARRASGIGLALLALPLRDVVAALPRGPESAAMPAWLAVYAAFHILRYLRYSERHGLVAVHRGRATAMAPSAEGSSICAAAKVTAIVLSALDLPTGTGKNSHPLTTATRWVLTRAPMGCLLRRRPIADLPPAILAGDWTTYLPQQHDEQRWWQHHVTLAHAYVALSGKVHEIAKGAITLEADDVLGYDWNPNPPTEDLYLRAVHWASSLVATYPIGQWPSDTLTHLCPQIRFVNPAHAAMFDALMLATLLRPSEPRLRHEYPLALLLAGSPTSEDSTNNGKTAASQLVLGAISPGARMVVSSRSTASQERRSICVSIAENGTLGLDEWSVAMDPEHLLNRENIQTLCTGGAVTYGLVRDNSAYALRLRTSMVANAKALRMPDDIVNRTLFMWCDPLTEAQRADAAGYNEILSGRASTRLRLSALGCIEAHADALAIPPNAATTVSGSRFPVHRALAIAVYRLRNPGTTLEVAAADIDLTHQTLALAYHQHMVAAASSGLLADLASKQLQNDITFEDLWTDATVAGMIVIHKRWKDLCREAKYAGTTSLLDAATTPEMSRDPNATLAERLSKLIGDRNISDLRLRVIERRFGQTCRAQFPRIGHVLAVPGIPGLAGWQVRRDEDRNGRMQLSLENISPSGGDVPSLTPLKPKP